MSKIKKKRTSSLSPISELDLKFEKIVQFSGWIFFLALIGFFGAWFLLDGVLDMIDLEIGSITFAFIVFIGSNIAISFALASKIKNNRDNKKKLFLDWLIGEFFFCMFAIFTVAAYQW
ncbi:MAG: hypothetical protein ACFFEY_01395 [Candidatus Thorarchaeota archaeon]